jgi:hypothetical protein
MCGELIIAASTASEERLSSDRIDEVLQVGRPDGGHHLCSAVGPRRL